MLDEQAAQARLDAMGPQELLAHVALQGKCSALIKVTADLSDILFGAPHTCHMYMPLCMYVMHCFARLL